MKYRIWSVEHGKWWKGNKNGYTSDIKEAGLYSLYQANAICCDANRHLNTNIIPYDPPNETMVPVEED